MPRDLMEALDEEAEGWPASWNPEPGDNLVGTIRRYSTGPSAYGPVRTVIIERDNKERVSLWLSSTVLLDLFKRDKPKVGERIGVRYLGKHPEKKYRRWALVVDRDGSEPDFAPLGGEQGGSPPDPGEDTADPFENQGLPAWALGREGRRR